MDFCVGNIIDVFVVDMTSDGRAVAKCEKRVIFFEGALLGDLVKVRFTNIKKNYIEAELLEIVSYSKYRVRLNEEDKEQFVCIEGICSLMGLNYEKQLELKTNHLQNSLKRIGKFSISKINKIVACKTIYHYRNKTKYHIQYSPQTGQIPPEINIGFYQRKSHTIVESKNNMLQSKIARTLSMSVRNFFNTPTRPPIIQTLKFQSLTIKNSSITFETMLILQTGQEYYKENIDFQNSLIAKIKADIKKHNQKEKENYQLTSLIIKDKNKSNCIYGRNYITDKIGKYTFKISAETFYQVNQYQIEALYQTIKKYLENKKYKIIFDIYCGVGTIGQYLSKYAEKIIGIETNKSSIALAKENAEINKVENTEYYCGKAETIFPKIASQDTSESIAILDPPRAGCQASLLKAIATSSISTIIYTSCQPSTLSRDAKILASLGFFLKELSPVDMFPHTPHIEAVSIFESGQTLAQEVPETAS